MTDHAEATISIGKLQREIEHLLEMRRFEEAFTITVKMTSEVIRLQNYVWKQCK